MGGGGGGLLPSAALRAKIFVTRSPVVPPSSLCVFPLAPSHDLLLGCCPKRDEKGGGSAVPHLARLAAVLPFSLQSTLKGAVCGVWLDGCIFIRVKALHTAL